MFAATPDPPYTAVIFTSRRTTSDEAEYARAAERMEDLAGRQPGYLGIESARDPQDRFGITVSYWGTEAAARSWKQIADHLEVQRLGAAKWYEGLPGPHCDSRASVRARNKPDQDFSDRA